MHPVVLRHVSRGLARVGEVGQGTQAHNVQQMQPLNYFYQDTVPSLTNIWFSLFRSCSTKPAVKSLSRKF